ncbi:MAG: alpha/beta fold hydrolase [Burkholderiales bacterium]
MTGGMDTAGRAVQFTAGDGCVLAGTWFTADARRRRPVAVVLNCGAGIPAVHYRRFAAHLAAAGIGTLIYDYRGVGRSRPASLRRFAASIEDWAERDCAAAIDWLRGECPDDTLVGIGHSVGGVLLAGAPNVGRLARIVMLGAHTGYYGDYRRGWRLPMAVLWHGVMPAVTSVLGYFPGRALRLGDDLPKGVAMQWARRRAPFVRRAPHVPMDRMAHLVERCAHLTARGLIVTATDDGFATEAGAARVRAFLPGFAAEHWVITPREAGARKLGHFGFFRRAAEGTLWPRLVAWLAAAGDARPT